MNDLVPVRDSVYQWKTLYTKLSEGKLPNINEISLQNEAVDGLPASVTDLNGELEAPKDAGNVLPPPEEPIAKPEVYKETVPLGKYTGGDLQEMGRRTTARKTTKRSTGKSTKGKKKGASKRKTGGGVTKRRSKFSRSSVRKTNNKKRNPGSRCR